MLSRVFFVLAILLYADTAQANENRSLIVGVFVSEPWGFKDTNGQHSGICYDIMKAVMMELDRPMEVRLVPYPRLLRELGNGNIDAAYLIKTTNTDKVAVAIAPVAFDIKTIILPRKGFSLTSFADLAGRSVLRVSGSLLGKKFDDNATMKKIKVGNYDNALRMYNGERADAVAGSEPSIVWNAKKNQIIIDHELERALVIGTTSGWVLLSKKAAMEEDAQTWVAATERVHQSGTLNKILRRYGYSVR